MDLNKLTLKSQEAVRAAQELARSRNHQLVEPAHLLAALLADAEGVVFPLLPKLGQSPRALRDRAEEFLDRSPNVYGPQEDPYLSAPSRRVLERAFTEAAVLSDEYVSTEHLFLALLEGTTDVASLLRESGIARDK